MNQTPPIDQAVQQLSRELAASLEIALTKAITARIGPNWVLPELYPRLQRIVHDFGVETFLLDGKPLLAVGPPLWDWQRDGDATVAKVSRRYKVHTEEET
jgi:hypothetical protein